jgi:hypothetical protein
MDATILTAIITSVTSAASTVGVAITALVLNTKRFDLIERRMDRLEESFVKRLDRIDAKLEGIDARLNEMTIDIAKLKIGYHE